MKLLAVLLVFVSSTAMAGDFYRLDAGQFERVLSIANVLVEKSSNGDSGLVLITKVEKDAKCETVPTKLAIESLATEISELIGVNSDDRLILDLKDELEHSLFQDRVDLCSAPRAKTKILLAKDFVLGFDSWSAD